MRTQDVGTLALRLGVGGALAAHGAQKLFGSFGGPGREATGQAFGHLGFPNPDQAVLAAAAGELVGGTMLAAGLATPAAAAAVIGTMRTASDVHKSNGFFAASGGYELPATYGLAAAAIALKGPGKLSLDHLLGYRLARPWMAMAGIAAGVVAGTLVARTRQAPPEQHDDEVVDITAAERADDAVAEGVQTPV
ncbi:MAG: mhqP 3 [Actinomycetia bacterium]|nr:mhqP 3 [Actinomycetes bacterium]